MSIGVFQHVICTYDGSFVRIYVDGVEKAKASKTSAISDSSSDPLGIGGRILDQTNHFNGLIDEARISNVARTEQWIATEYNNQSDVDAFLTFGAEENATSTEFISKIRAYGNGGDYDKLSVWEGIVQTDLTATTTRVFSGSLTGTLSYDDTVELFRSGTYLNITASVIATSTGGQMLVDGIAGANYDLVAQSGDQWRLASSTDNMWTITGTTGNELGDTAIAVAECYNDWPSGLEDNVTINGWTTNATNYVKVYTPISERHNGRAKDSEGNYTGFALKTSSTAISPQEIYTVIDGLIIEITSSSASGISANSNGKYSTISNNIAFKTTGSSGSGINTYAGWDQNIYIYNNIIYGTGGANFGVGIYAAAGTIYNNAVYACNTGIESYNYDVDTKNNISFGNTTDYVGTTFSPASNNISSDSTAPGTGSLTNQTLSDIAFVSTESGSEDFHIQSTSVAKGAGADLSATFTTDIDDQTRLGAWDIGADEFNEITHLIRKTYTIDSDSGDISRSSNVVTVNLTTEHDNLKVGQTIKVWDVDDSTFDGYFTIASVASTTQFTYAQSGSDANSANGSVGGDYELLSTWEADQQRDLVTAQQIEVAECYADWSSGMSGYITIDGWTTSTDYYVKIYTPTSERHAGAWDDNKFWIDTGHRYGFSIISANVKIEGIQIYNKLDYASIYSGIKLNTSSNAGVYINNNIIKDFNNRAAGGIQIAYKAGATNRKAYISNNIIYDYKKSGAKGIYIDGDAGNWTVYAYNNTIYNCDIGYSRSASTFISKNNIAQDCTNGFSGTFDSSSSNNLSDLADDASGTGSRNSTTVTFADEDNDDFHLASTDAGARNQGTDLSADTDYAFSTDIDGDTRPYNGLWDIGADEASGYAITKMNSPYTDSGNWYNANWKYRKSITLQSSQISTTTDAFPVLATTTLTDLKSYAYDGKVAKNNGHDIIFVDDDNSTLLNYEREKYDPTTGEIAYWIKTDISSTTDKTIYMYYGNSGASDVSTTTGVWDDNFVMVQHMHHDWDASAVDSTKYDNDGTNTNFYSATSSVSTGQVDGAIDFDGVDDYVNVGQTAFFNSVFASSFTLSIWINPTSNLVTNDAFLGIGLGGPEGMRWKNAGDSDWQNIVINGTSFTASTTLSANTPAYISVTVGSSNVVFYHNGIIDGVPLTGQPGYINAVKAFQFGGTNSSYSFPGLIDEVRISNVARTAQWIATEYNNQSDVASFLTIGAEESSATTKVSSPQTNKLIVNAPITNYLTGGLVGHWTFNGQDMDWASTTAEALDRSGNANNGNVIGATAAIGKVGQGLDFDGSDDYVDVPDANSLDATSVTLSAWVKSDTAGRYIIAKDPPEVTRNKIQ
ncbi:DUF2341 domain-containing protein, partial [bacterium]|nr:DUF2341 domain-containing protein [bacterium]